MPDTVGMGRMCVSGCECDRERERERKENESGSVVSVWVHERVEVCCM